MPVSFTDAYVEKRLSPRERSEPESLFRLRNEADLLEALASAPLAHGAAAAVRVGVQDVVPRLVARGEDAAGPWHRMERVRLPLLGERRAEPPWVERAARVALEALALLHESPLAIVHGDLSPANIAADETRTVFLDFDLSSWRGGSLPRDGAFRGTIATASPEAARGEPLDARSDLFALAASFVSVSLGRPLREGPLSALLVRAAEEPILDDGLRARLIAFGPAHSALAACLSFDRDARPRSARDALW
jgi:serine/threonine protein kinase